MAEEPTEDLAGRVDLMKREIDGLQIAITSQKKPWYKDISTLISVLALAFSFGTTMVSYRRTQVQDIESSRQELRAMLRRLTAIPREMLDTRKRYGNDQSAILGISQMYNQENAMLARQAAEISKSLPPKVVSATEYSEIALSLQNAYNLGSAKEFFQLAIDNAKDFNDEIGAIRGSANLEFMTGQPQAGRVRYEQALNIFSKYPGYDNFTKTSTDVYTELFWSQSEAAMGQFPLAIQHANNAQKIVDTMPFSLGAEALKTQISDQMKLFKPGISPNPVGAVPLLPATPAR